MNPQGIANVLNALSKLDAAAAAVSQEGWKQLAEAAEWQAREMKPRGNVLRSASSMLQQRQCRRRDGNALPKLPSGKPEI